MKKTPRTTAVILEAPALGSKSIGLLGSVMLLTNNLAGPTISLMPGLVQQAGWAAMIVEMLVLAVLSAACGFMLLAAVRAMPGNREFDERVEFSDLLKFYLPNALYVPSMLSYFAYVVLTLMSYIIQTAQVMDYACLDIFGCAYALQLTPQMGVICGNRKDSDTPFSSSSTVISLSFCLIVLVCAPLACLNLDDNIVLQITAIVGLSVLATIWIIFLMAQPDFPATIPSWTSHQGPLFSTLLFNFAFMSALPSWANEKQADVSVGLSFALTMVYVGVVYCAVGIIGGLAYPPYYQTDQNLFSKLNGSGSKLGQFTVQIYPILQNFTSIPVFAIFIKYNLIQLGWFNNAAATCNAFIVPWLLSIPFYTGSGFQTISSVGGLVFSLYINFFVPVLLYVQSKNRNGTYVCIDDSDSAPEDAESLDAVSVNSLSTSDISTDRNWRLSEVKSERSLTLELSHRCA